MDHFGRIRKETYDNDKCAASSLRQGIVALAFVFVGSGKLVGTAAMVELFDEVGLGQWFRYLTGLLEVVSCIGLLIPRYAFYAAVLLVIVMTGAIFTHVAVVGGSPAPAASLFVLSGIIAWSSARARTDPPVLSKDDPGGL
jgi:uncharacterized membrane protein YphA (DoxX/SURF4 family)